MDKIDNKTLIHIGVETVVIVGVSFWFNKKINALQEDINILKDLNIKYEEIINKQGEIIMSHEQLFNQILPPQRVGPSSTRQPQSYAPTQIHPQGPLIPHQNISTPIQPTQSRSPSTQIPPPLDPQVLHTKIIEEEYTPSELDDIIKEEINDIEKSRNDKTCNNNNGVCKISSKKKSKE